MRQVGSRLWPAAVVPANGVAEYAGVIQEYLLAALLERDRMAAAAGCNCASIQALNLLRASATTQRPCAHAAVRRTRRTGRENARLSASIHSVVTREDQIALAVQIRDPEAVNDIV